MKMVSFDFATGEAKYEEADNINDDSDSFKSFPSSAQEAKKYGYTQYFTSKPCKRGHIAHRFTCDNSCLECVKIKRKRLRAKMTDEDKIVEREHNKKLRHAKSEQYRKTAKKYTERKKEEIQENARIRYHTKLKHNPIYKLHRTIAGGIWADLKGKKGGQTYKTFINYTIEELKEYLEKQFTSEMNWDNYGSYWEIDHIIPRSFFGENVEESWVLKNLQPLTKSQNASKQNRYIGHPDNPQWITKEEYTNDNSI